MTKSQYYGMPNGGSLHTLITVMISIPLIISAVYSFASLYEFIYPEKKNSTSKNVVPGILEKEEGKRERTAERRSEGSEAQEAREGTKIEYPPRFCAHPVLDGF